LISDIESASITGLTFYSGGPESAFNVCPPRFKLDKFHDVITPVKLFDNYKLFNSPPFMHIQNE